MIKLKGSHWRDENNNKWNIRKYSKNEAERLSKTLINCKNCTDCSNCINCSDCVECEDCLNCINCFCCSKCYECEGCGKCYNCDDCKNCSDCEDCVDCIECIQCINSIKCDGCGFCKNCYFCNDYINQKGKTEIKIIRTKNKTFFLIQADLRNYIQTNDIKFLKSVDQKLRLLLTFYNSKGCEMECDSSYYEKDKYRVIDKIQQILTLDFSSNHCLGFKNYLVGNIIKYVGRYYYKNNDLQEQCNDLLKAREYLAKLITVY